MTEEISSIDSCPFTDFLLFYLIIDSEVMWIYEGSVVSLPLQNINGCFLELLLFEFVIAHRDLRRVFYGIVPSLIRNVSPGTWTLLVLESKLVV